MRFSSIIKVGVTNLLLLVRKFKYGKKLNYSIKTRQSIFTKIEIFGNSTISLGENLYY